MVEPEGVVRVIATLDRNQPRHRAVRCGTLTSAVRLRDELTDTEFRACVTAGGRLDSRQVIDLALNAIARTAAAT